MAERLFGQILDLMSPAHADMMAQKAALETPRAAPQDKPAGFKFSGAEPCANTLLITRLFADHQAARVAYNFA